MKAYTIYELINLPIDVTVKVKNMPMHYKGDSPYILQTGSMLTPINFVPLLEYIGLKPHMYDLFDTYILVVIDSCLCAVFGMTGSIAYDQKVLTKVY